MMRSPAWWWRPRPNVVASALRPAGCVYAWAARARRRLARARRAAVPVVCVGNLVVGGAGKTPVAIALAERLVQHGLAVHLVTRGYGGALAGPVRVDPRVHSCKDVGDEALLLARDAPTWIARHRPDGIAAAAVAADVVVMDDGFQNPFVHPDASFLVIDGGQGFGNGLVLPAGPLREPIAQGLARAACVVLIGPGAPDVAVAAALERARKPVLRAELVSDVPCEIKTQPLVAFAGIGRPEKFFAALRAAGCDLSAARDFPDHHPYTDADLRDLRALAQRLGARLVTTEKDAMRFSQGMSSDILVVSARLVWSDPAGFDRALGAALDRTMGATRGRAFDNGRGG